MALIKSVRGNTPVIGENTYIAENATIVGEVKMGKNCSVWFNAVIRGDVHSITIGDNTNIQDGVVIHCSYLEASTTIGNNVSVGHNALVHGCDIKDNVLIGMGSIIMDHVVVNEYCIIAAGSVVLSKTICESGYLYAGSPARKVKPITEEQRKFLDNLPQQYIKYAGWFTEEE
jgi:carbonic anhydrase/acetyltransferase-like protein (isoleucine patch superfamily)